MKLNKLIAAGAAASLAIMSTGAQAAPVDVDILFVIDQSGSMANEFQTLGANIGAFTNGLSGNADVSSLQFGLVTYEDASLGTSGNCFGGACLDLAQALTANSGDLATALNTASTNTFGGTEDALAAVASTLPGGELFNSIGWRNNTVKSVVLITDENADDAGSFTFNGQTGYAALGAQLDSVNYLNNIITNTSLFNVYSAASRPNATAGQALFDLNQFTGANADPQAFLTAFANAKLQEITTGGTTTTGSNPVPLPGTAWLMLASLGGMGLASRTRKAKTKN